MVTTSSRRPTRSEAIAVYLIYLSIAARTLTVPTTQHMLGLYLGLQLLSLLLFSLVIWHPDIPSWLMHLYFVLQVSLVLALLWLWPDFVVILFIPLCYQAAVVLADPARQVWIAVILSMLGGTMTYYHGIRGLALALIPMAGGFLFAMQVILSRQLAADRRQSQATIAQLQVVNQQLQEYAQQVEELTALEERNRLARRLHDSVAQSLFSITLNARAAQLLLEMDPSRLRDQLEQLHTQTQAALAEMRTFIAQLRASDE